MAVEEFIESGKVIKIDGKIVEVELNTTDACEECTAKIFCKPKSDGKKTLTAVDEIGVSIGDKVKISLAGKIVFKMSFLLYGIPLILLVVGIFIGLRIFADNASIELFSFLFGLSIMIIYYFVFYLLNKKRINLGNMPRVVGRI
ncbi:MAG: SoxR reducing system RseC family protein [Ignavibacteriales bacterium]|nr:SoxR reducing system RseC family protein [Ignavibacteriales bacterium]